MLDNVWTLLGKWNSSNFHIKYIQTSKNRLSKIGEHINSPIN